MRIVGGPVPSVVHCPVSGAMYEVRLCIGDQESSMSDVWSDVRCDVRCPNIYAMSGVRCPMSEVVVSKQVFEGRERVGLTKGCNCF